MYRLTQGPESVILKYCQWMASEGKNVSHLSVNELIICPLSPCSPLSPFFFVVLEIRHVSSCIPHSSAASSFPWPRAIAIE